MLSLPVTRRQFVTAAALSTALPQTLTAMAQNRAKTPPLTAEEIAAIETALGKKGRWVEAEAVHTSPLPRADLKVTIKGQPAPTPLGFGGWMSVQADAGRKERRPDERYGSPRKRS